MPPEILELAGRTAQISNGANIEVLEPIIPPCMFEAHLGYFLGNALRIFAKMPPLLNQRLTQTERRLRVRLTLGMGP